MIPKYVPILKAKQGEFVAYGNLTKSIKEITLPVFEIPGFTRKVRDSKTYRDLDSPKEVFLNKCAQKINAVVDSNPVMIDISRWAPNSTIESGEHVLTFITSRLESIGSEVIPVIGYERWEDDEYKSVFNSLSRGHHNFAIRLDPYAFDDMIEEDHFYECFNDIVETMDLDCSKCSVILDFSDVTESSIAAIHDKAVLALKMIKKYGFKFVSIAGCSVSSVVNDMVPEQNSTGIVSRKELIAWKAVNKFSKGISLVFGDYGISNPNMAEDVKAPHANGKIRYTIEESYFVIRGYSRQKEKKGEQMYDLCRLLMSSPYYKGPLFSWGDKKIEDCSNELFKGNLTNWVSIDTNHHITLVLNEVLEFEKSLSIPKTRELVR